MKKPTPENRFFLAEAVTREMCDPAFWSEDDTVVMDRESIERLNAANPPRIRYTDEALKTRELFRAEVGEALPGAEVKKMICELPLPKPGIAYSGNGELFDEASAERLSAARNTENIPEAVAVSYGVCVKRTLALAYPVDEPYYKSGADIYYNRGIHSELLPGEALILLHTSADGLWCFVMADFFTGWIRKEALAFCKDKAEWEKIIAPEEFLVVTAETLLIDPVLTMPDTFEEKAYMGQKLILAEKRELLNGRASYGAYCVRLPARDENGRLYFVEATVAVSQAVHEGYLPLSSKNILKQAFQHLGHTYGWGGTAGRTDCSGMARQVLHCFGIELPRNSEEIREFAGPDTARFEEELSCKRRMDILSGLMPGSILCLKGHIMIYLGIKGGVPYCVSACGSFSDGKGQKTVNCVCISTLNVVQGNGRTWLESLTAAHNFAKRDDRR